MAAQSNSINPSLRSRKMNQQNACAYLDLLGFKYFLSRDLKGAIALLDNHHTIISLHNLVREMRQKRNRPKSLVELAKRNEISSFDYFLPFSDSIFIQSSKPEKFVAQLSSFLLNTFLFKSHAFGSPENFEDPSIITMTNLKVDESGDIISTQTSEYWFPVMFRGGISFGECHPMKINSIIENKLQSIFNLVGKAVVEAVKIEQTVKGPRLICSKSFYDALRGSFERYIIKIDNNYEILWPAYAFIAGNDAESELINQFEDLFLPAVNLWKAYNHFDDGIHYYNFLKLIVRSTLHYFSFNDGDLKVARDFIANRLKQVDLGLKRRDLMGSHYA
jgi:hypothetical protein